jgi:hypothetical protein
VSNKKYINLNVEGTNLDLPDKELNIELTLRNPCSDGFGEISGSESKRSFRLPATKTNDAAFENWWDVSLQNSSSAPLEKDAFIEVNGLRVLSGKAQLKEVTTVGRFYERQGKDYQVSLVGDNADWFSLLEDLELGRDLDWSSQLHNLTNAEVTAGYNAAPADIYGYAVLKFQDWANIDKVDVYESTPVLFIGKVLEKIFNSIGYIFAPGFFSNVVAERYVLPAPLNIGKYPQEFSEDYLNVAAEKNITQNIASTPLVNGVSFDVQTQTPNIGPNPLVLSTPSSVVVGAGNTARYTAPYAGFYQIKFAVTVDNIGPGTVSFVFFPLGDGIGITLPPGRSLTSLDNGNTYSVELVAQMEAGDVVEFYAGIGPSGASLNITSAFLEIIGEAVIKAGTLIDFSYLLRDWKITDFIKGVTAAFNLCWDTNVDLKTISCTPKDDYVITDRSAGSTVVLSGYHSATTVDSQPKLDYNKEGLVRALNDISETQQYRWTQDSSDKTAEAQNDNETQSFDSCRYDLPLNRFKKATEENDVELFAPTLMLFDRIIQAESSTITPLVPLLWPNNYRENPTADNNTTEFAPRILWFGGQRSSGGQGLDGEINLYDSLTDTDSVVLLPACFFVNYNDPTGLDVSLNWSTLQLNGNEVLGHMQRFYLRELRRKREGKELEEWFYWDELDISQINFGQKVFIDGDLYILKEIDGYSPVIDQTTKTILIYDPEVELEDVNRINNTLSIGFLGNYNNEE